MQPVATIESGILNYIDPNQQTTQDCDLYAITQAEAQLIEDIRSQSC